MVRIIKTIESGTISVDPMVLRIYRPMLGSLIYARIMSRVITSLRFDFLFER